jgi:hypothetical protein
MHYAKFGSYHSPEHSCTLKSALANNNIPHILCNPTVHYCVRNSPQLVPTLSQMNPVQILPSGHFTPTFKLRVPIHQCHHWHMLLLRATIQHMLAPSNASHLQGRSDIRGSIFLQNSSTLLLITQLYTPKTRVSFSSQSPIHKSSVMVTSTEQGHRHFETPLVNLYWWRWRTWNSGDTYTWNFMSHLPTSEATK